MSTTVVVLAAGIGARYGGGTKQLTGVGPNGELIIEYSVHDAVKAGFDRVVFILRRDIYDDFRSAIGERLEATLHRCNVTVDYAFQNVDDLPAGRKKPWGTGHALLCCRELLDGPFVVINADDYYGKTAFVKAYEFLTESDRSGPDSYGMIGYRLKNTLSKAGGVTRGICAVNSAGELIGIMEMCNIIATPSGAAVNDGTGTLRPLDVDSVVSMNMWMLNPFFLSKLRQGFEDFRMSLKEPFKDEYLLPTIIHDQIQMGAKVKVIPTAEAWFGVTYKEDVAPVMEAFKRLEEQGIYPKNLFSDIAGM